MPMPRSVVAVASAAVLVPLAGCSSTSSGSGTTTYDVEAGDTTCNVEKTTFAAGTVAFKVENIGSDVTEVYVYGKEGADFTQIMGEVENIGPGTSRDFTVSLDPGDYQVACKPGMTGDGIRTDITVTGKSGSGTSTQESDESYDRELEFTVASSGSVQAPAGSSSASTGERIEFKLHNGSTKEHYLELLDPDGQRAGMAVADGGENAEFVAELAQSGDYTVSIYADDEQGQATTSTLSVRD
jgi:iron uptake system component EfeO